MSEERCSVTELLTEQCDHCRPAQARPVFRAPAGATREYGPTVTAFFGGSCVSCDDRIDQGDEICMSPEGWIHTDCKEE